MKRHIYIANDFAKLRPYLTDQFFILAERIAEEYDFKIIYTMNLLKSTKDADTVFIFAGAHGKPLLVQAGLLPPKVKVIFYLGGMHSFIDKRDMLKKAMDRANFITSGCNDGFLNLWPEHAGKFEFLPNFFAPQKRYTSLRFKRKPKFKCLLTGHTGNGVYPFRHFIKGSIAKDQKLQKRIDVMAHPRWSRKKGIVLEPWEIPAALNWAYAKILNSYYCTIATASRFSYALAKVAEIPAAGSLLLAERIKDLDAMEYIPYVHYLPIEKGNVFNVIDAVLNNPEEFNIVRKTGRDFARANHGVENRVKQFGKILRSING